MSDELSKLIQAATIISKYCSGDDTVIVRTEWWYAEGLYLGKNIKKEHVSSEDLKTLERLNWEYSSEYRCFWNNSY